MATEIASRSTLRIKGFGLLLIVLATAIGVRIYAMGAQCYWYDELLTLELINGHGHPNVDLSRNVIIAHPPPLVDPSVAAPWWKIWNNSSGDVHPPLYFICCRWWRDLFDNSETETRSLSVLFSVSAIVVLYYLVRAVNGAQAAIASALLMALAAPQVSYAQEARGYSLLTLVSLLAAWALVRMEQRGMNAWRWAGLTATLLASALTHYYSFGFLVALGVYTLIIFRGRKLLAALAAFLTAGILFLLVWGKNLLAQRQMLLHDYPMYADSHGHTWITLLRALATPMRHLIGLNMETTASVLAAIALVIAAILSLIYRRRDLLLWWLWMIGAIATVTIIDLARTAEQLTMVKYTFVAAPAVFVIAAGCLPARFLKAQFVIVAILAGLEIAYLPAVYTDWKGHWREMAEFVLDKTPPNDPVIFAGNGTGRHTTSWMYLGMNVYINPWPRAIAISDREPSPALMEQLKKYPRLTLVTDCLGATPDEILPGFEPIAVPEYFANIGRVWQMGRVTIGKQNN